MNVEEQRNSSARSQGRGWEWAGTVYIDEVSVMRFGQLRDLSPGSGDIKRKSDCIGKSFAARMIRTAVDEIDGRLLLFELLGERPFRRKGNAGLPSLLIHRDDEIKKASLRTAELAELIDEQNPHRRRAVASTQK